MVLVISIIRHTYFVDRRIDKYAHIDEVGDEGRYVDQEEDANDRLRLTPYCINA